MHINGRGIAYIGYDPVTFASATLGTINATAPLPTLLLVGPASIALTVPSFTLSIIGEATEPGYIEASMPLPTLAVRGGGTLTATMTIPTLGITGTSVITTLLAATMPLPTLLLTARTGAVGRFTTSMPDMSLRVYGGGTLTAAAPSPTLSLSGRTGAAGVIAAAMPKPSLLITATARLTGVISATLPFPIAPYGNLLGRMPLPTLNISQALAENNLIAYAMNIKTNEVTTYSNYAFKFIVRIGFDYYGVKSDGLYKLTGITDDGAAITATFRIAETDFGTSLYKNLPYCYHDSDKPVTVTPIVDGTPVGVFPSHESGRRTRLAKGAKGKIWQLEVSNVDGNELKVGSLEALAEVLSRKV